MVLFSGDSFNPSLMSTVTKGAQMPPVLNAAGVQAAVVGNHDLDFGLAQFERLSSQCIFPWLMANLLDRTTSEVFPGCKRCAGQQHVWPGQSTNQSVHACVHAFMRPVLASRGTSLEPVIHRAV